MVSLGVIPDTALETAVSTYPLVAASFISVGTPRFTLQYNRFTFFVVTKNRIIAYIYA